MARGRPEHERSCLAMLGRVKSPSESEPLDVEDAISRYLT
jgi:hypothetical protein